MTLGKRVFDLVLAFFLSALLIVPFAMLCMFVLLREGRPLLYKAERMKSAEDGFELVKLRTMRSEEQNTGVTGGDKAGRSSPLQLALRRYRLDELPQLWNILRGDMSFVGPRPPLRQYVTAFPDLYEQVLKSRPGITGLASLVFHEHEEAILKNCLTAEETDTVYRRRCVPRKARLDLMYQRKSSVCFDFLLLWRTFRRVFT